MLRSAGETDILTVHFVASLVGPSAANRDPLGQVAITLAVHCQEHEFQAALQSHLATKDQMYPVVLCLDMSTHHASQ
jgi:hypothetical protein